MSTVSPFDSRAFLASCTSRPGVYQMYSADGDILYVGKAKNLKNRLSSYFSGSLSLKTAALVEKIRRIDVTVTRTEAEALLLEQNLIKSARPPYNILLRDDKSYPYVYLDTEHGYPRLAFHRGSKRKKGRYFGPYPSSHAVRESLNIMQKAFKVRQCEDSFFNNRTRPCLQYQIGRCSAPCVGLVEDKVYQASVEQSILFLKGRSEELHRELSQQMDQASQALEFERAAEYRDQIAYLRRVQQDQSIESGDADVDVVAVANKAADVCVQVLFIRGGRMLGSRAYYPKMAIAETQADRLEAFLPQFYLQTQRFQNDCPAEIIVSEEFPSQQLLQDALAQAAGHAVRISNKVRSRRAKWLQMAEETAQQNVMARANKREKFDQRMDALQKALDMPQPIQRVECFDISHSSGELTVASCVVFDREGPRKADYRKFNIDDITPGDDYAAMQQALSRRFQRIRRGESICPDILLIDGGKGQHTQAVDVLKSMDIDDVLIVGVAKGRSRKAGMEVLYVGASRQELTLPSDDSALHLIQLIRDEAHRFAITGHRARRAKKRNESPLEGIAGVGAKRRSAILRHFGGWQEVMQATQDELSQVTGVSKKLAAEIYAVLHND